jgi:hypothetical protein
LSIGAIGVDLGGGGHEKEKGLLKMEMARFRGPA